MLSSELKVIKAILRFALWYGHFYNSCDACLVISFLGSRMVKREFGTVESEMSC